MNPETTAITSGRNEVNSLSAPIWATSVWESESLTDARSRAMGMKSANFYGRYANPTVSQLEAAVAELEHAQSALAFSSGMGAMSTTILALCSQGSHIVAQDNMYGATMAFLRGPCARLGIETTFVDARLPGAFAAAVVPGRTTLVIAETPSNPLLTISDLEELGAIKGPFTLVDSTLATPLGQQPLGFGIDLVLHSATKGIGGHNDALLGVIAGETDLIEAVWAYSVMHGSVPSPHDAASVLRGLRTLPVRIERQHSSAMRLAGELSNHRRVTAVHHPFLDSHPQNRLATSQMALGGTVLSFELEGGFDACARFVEATRLARIATSFGGPETLICHPATSTHVGLTQEDQLRAGITESLLRVSVGLEAPDDLVGDLIGALDASA